MHAGLNLISLPQNDVIQFDYVFASDEYNEYVDFIQFVMMHLVIYICQNKPSKCTLYLKIASVTINNVNKNVNNMLTISTMMSNL